MATFVLTGLSVEKVSQAEQKNLREALGGGFHVSVELTGSNPYFRMDDDGEGALDRYTELPVTQDMMDVLILRAVQWQGSLQMDYCSRIFQ